MPRWTLKAYIHMYIMYMYIISRCLAAETERIEAVHGAKAITRTRL
jgi:hypothetical protein